MKTMRNIYEYILDIEEDDEDGYYEIHISTAGMASILFFVFLIIMFELSYS